MDQQLIQREHDFLIELRELAINGILEHCIAANGSLVGFDVAKGIKALERAIDGEIDFLHYEPQYYFDIYDN